MRTDTRTLVRRNLGTRTHASSPAVFAHTSRNTGRPDSTSRVRHRVLPTGNGLPFRHGWRRVPSTRDQFPGDEEPSASDDVL